MIICKTRKWGNSLGIVIPKTVADDLMLAEAQEVTVEIKKKENPLKEMFGALKFDEPTEKILREIRRKESKYL